MSGNGNRNSRPPERSRGAFQTTAHSPLPSIILNQADRLILLDLLDPAEPEQFD